MASVRTIFKICKYDIVYRYAFSPLLDAPEDDDEDEDKVEFINESYGTLQWSYTR